MKITALLLILFVWLNHCTNGQQTNNDTLWNHTIEESDLILKVMLTDKKYVTEAGMFTGKVLQVTKGNCSLNKISFYLELIENSTSRYKSRFDAITHQTFITIGFKKDESLLKIIEIDHVGYAFFMSQ
jgi:hypothetical protein